MAAEPWERNKLRNPHLRNHGTRFRPRSVSGSAIWINCRPVEDAFGETQETACGSIPVPRRRSRHLAASLVGKDRAANHRRSFGGVGTGARFRSGDAGRANTFRVRHSRLAGARRIRLRFGGAKAPRRLKPAHRSHHSDPRDSVAGAAAAIRIGRRRAKHSRRCLHGTNNRGIAIRPRSAAGWLSLHRVRERRSQFQKSELESRRLRGSRRHPLARQQDTAAHFAEQQLQGERRHRENGRPMDGGS